MLITYHTHPQEHFLAYTTTSIPETCIRSPIIGGAITPPQYEIRETAPPFNGHGRQRSRLSLHYHQPHLLHLFTDSGSAAFRLLGKEKYDTKGLYKGYHSPRAGLDIVHCIMSCRTLSAPYVLPRPQ